MNIDIFSILENFYLAWGLPTVFFSSLFEISPFGWMIPGGSLIAIAGFFAYGRPLYLLAIIIFSWFGAWSTFIAAYFLGAKTGSALIAKFKQERAARRAEDLLDKHGPIILTTSMLASLTRFWVAYIAGSRNYKFSKFVFYSGSASLTWTSLVVMIGYLAGSERDKLEAGLAKFGILAWVLVIVAIGVVYWKTREDLAELKDGDS